MQIDNKAFAKNLAMLITRDGKAPLSDSAMVDFVKKAEPMLQMTAMGSAAEAAQLYGDFFVVAGFSAAEKASFIQALGKSDNPIIKATLAKSLGAALKAQEVYDAKLPAELTSVQVLKVDVAEASHVRAGRVSVLTGLGPKGKGADIFDIPADIVITPQHRTVDVAKGGGTIGGVAAWGLSRVAERTKGQPADVKKTAVAAMGAWESKLTANKSFVAQPGHGELHLTGVEDPTVFTSAVFHDPSVAPKELQLNTMNEAERTSSQRARLLYAESMLSETLRTMAEQDTALRGEASGAAPRVVVLPMLGTGPSGVVTEAEAGWAYARVAAGFLKEHPGYELVFAPYGSYSPSEFAENQKKFISGLTAGAAGETPPGIDAADIKSPEQLLQGLAAGARALVKAQPTKTVNLADEETLREQLDAVMSKITRSLDKQKSADGYYADRFNGGAVITREADAFVSEAFWQLHRMAELPAKAQHYTGGSGATDNDPLATVSKESIAELAGSRALLLEVQRTLQAVLAGSEETITAPKDRLGDLVAMALARTLQVSRFEYVSKTHDRMLKEVQSGDERVKELMSQFGTEHTTLVELLTDAKDRLLAATEQGLAFGDAAQDYEKRIAELERDTSLLQTNERQLRAELQDKIRELAKAQKDVAKLQAAASSAASSSSYRSSSSYTG